MSKHYTSRFHNDFKNVSLPIVVVLTVGLLWLFVSGQVTKHWFVLIVAIVGSVMAAIVWYEIIFDIFDDPFYGEVSFDNEKVIFYTMNHKKIIFRYDECEEIGMIRNHHLIEGSGTMDGRVYFSKKRLTIEQKKQISLIEFNDKKAEKLGLPRYKTEYVFFEYNPDSIRDLKENLPEALREMLIEDEKRCLEEYSVLLKRHRDYWCKDGRTDIQKRKDGDDM